MHIVNIMFSAIGGGIEQAFVDYCEALQLRGHRVTAITHPRALVNPQLATLGIETISLRNLGEYDPIAIRRLRGLFTRLSPDAVLTHTHRSFSLAKRAGQGHCPLVGVLHNYHARARRLKHADAVLTTTHDLMHFVQQFRVPPERIFHIPNLVRCHELPQRNKIHSPPVIGAMGRFVKKKGFDVYIDALALMRARGHKFKAILGGVGEEAAALRQRAKAAGLEDILSFPGWVKDKKAFYQGIDIFCLPSLHEPFGIVLLEAFMFGAPVAATDSEGPRDIIAPGVDALLVKTGDAAALAEAMIKLIEQPELGRQLAANAFIKVKTQYSLESVAERMETALKQIVARGPRRN